MKNKILTITAILLGTIFMTQGAVYANTGIPSLPDNFFIKENQKQVVAYYPAPSDHTIVMPDGSISYDNSGFDIVKQNGNSGNFQQWYFGEDGSNYHSTWKVQKNDKCPRGSLEIEQAQNPPTGDTWGDYLTVDADYCVKTNEIR